ncbi:hypothetical protein MMC26_002462 [Xylographa opegraphella]|nr:hypothetical protein [Xylographa opegraphella]
MDKIIELDWDINILSNDERGATSITENQSTRNSHIHKRPYSCLANEDLQVIEERQPPSKFPRKSLGQQSSSKQTILLQSSRRVSDRSLVSDNSLVNNDGSPILSSGGLYKQQTRAPVIDLDKDMLDEGDDDSNANRADLLFLFNRVKDNSSNPDFPNIKNFMSDEEFNRIIAHQQMPKPYRRILDAQSPSILPARIAVDKHDLKGQRLTVGVTVELQNEDFIKISEMQQEPISKIIYLRGWLFRRLRFMKGAIEKKMNELCQLHTINQADVKSYEEQAIHEVDIKYVKSRRKLIITNRPYPELSFREEEHIPGQTAVMNEGVLVCRWRNICFFPNERAVQKNAHCEKALIAFRSNEVHRNYSTNNNNLRERFRGETISGGDSSTSEPAKLALIHGDRDLANTASYLHGELLHSTESSLVNIPGSSSTLPINVDVQFSRLSLEPIEFGSGSQSRVSRTNGEAYNTFLYRNGPLERHVAKNPPNLSITGPIWDADKEEFVNTSPIPGSRSDSDFTVTGDDHIDATELEELYEVPRPRRYVPLIGNHNKLHLRAQPGIFDRLNTVNTHRPDRRPQTYTFGDGFCGCGGVSRGATIAGLSLQWAFDFESQMCTSYTSNFPDTPVFCSDAFDFATGRFVNVKVDILHLSPPCQFFSPAHTTAGANDEINTAASFVIGELVKRVMPRVVTLENTLGLEQRHHVYLHAVIQQFTVLGFSVRWKIIDLRDYGVPQSRRRLIIIAACPGEILPDFPAPTHSKSPAETGLKPWVTINESIDAIPEDCPDHDVSKASQKQRPPFDGNTQAKCITTSGGSDNYHPSGQRGYTVREYACLQTFPLEHVWGRSATTSQRRKQIGNAVPPIFYAALARKIVQSLRKADGVEEVIDLTD